MLNGLKDAFARLRHKGEQSDAAVLNRLADEAMAGKLDEPDAKTVARVSEALARIGLTFQDLERDVASRERLVGLETIEADGRAAIKEAHDLEAKKKAMGVVEHERRSRFNREMVRIDHAIASTAAPMCRGLDARTAIENDFPDHALSIHRRQESKLADADSAVSAITTDIARKRKQRDELNQYIGRKFPNRGGKNQRPFPPNWERQKDIADNELAAAEEMLPAAMETRKRVRKETAKVLSAV